MVTSYASAAPESEPTMPDDAGIEHIFVEGVRLDVVWPMQAIYEGAGCLSGVCHVWRWRTLGHEDYRPDGLRCQCGELEAPARKIVKFAPRRRES
jgi:hypothetical protein